MTNRELIIKKFLECTTDCEIEVTKDILNLFKDISYISIARPLVLKSRLENNLSMGQLQIKYKLKDHQVKKIIKGTKLVPN